MGCKSLWCSCHSFNYRSCGRKPARSTLGRTSSRADKGAAKKNTSVIVFTPLVWMMLKNRRCLLVCNRQAPANRLSRLSQHLSVRHYIMERQESKIILTQPSSLNTIASTEASFWIFDFWTRSFRKFSLNVLY